MQVGSLRTHLSRHPAAWASFDLHSKFPVEFSSELPSLHACVLFPVFSESNDKTLVSSESWVYTTCPPPATQVDPGPCSWGAQGAPARWPCTPPVLARAWPGPVTERNVDYVIVCWLLRVTVETQRLPHGSSHPPRGPGLLCSCPVRLVLGTWSASSPQVIHGSSPGLT